MLKSCKKCGAEQPLDNFAVENASFDGRQRWCRICQRAWRKVNTKRLQESNRKCRLKKLAQYQAKSRRDTLKKYGLTPESYQAMLEEQQGLCLICGTHAPQGQGNKFHVDHCHATGKVRGLLCHHCNKGLGQFRDDPAVIYRAAAYLEERKNCK